MPNIRTVRPEDAEEIYTIYRPFVEESAVSFESEMPSLSDFAERIVRISSKYPYLVMEENGEILGYAYGSLHRERAAYRWCVETTIYMAEKARGKGYGKLLYDVLMEQLIQRGFTVAYGIITLPNPGSVNLHKKCGFYEISVHKKTGYKLNEWHDVLWMERTLAPFTNPPKEPRFGE